MGVCTRHAGVCISGLFGILHFTTTTFRSKIIYKPISHVTCVRPAASGILQPPTAADDPTSWRAHTTSPCTHVNEPQPVLQGLLHAHLASQCCRCRLFMLHLYVHRGGRRGTLACRMCAACWQRPRTWPGCSSCAQRWGHLANTQGSSDTKHNALARLCACCLNSLPASHAAQ